MSDTPRASPQDRLGWLDAVRGFAVLWIMWFHCYEKVSRPYQYSDVGFFEPFLPN